MKIRRIILLSLLVFMALSCKQQAQKEIILKTENGEPKLIYYTIENEGKKERVKEELYYDNGSLQYSGEFKNDIPSGKWKYYFENGNLFAEGSFIPNNTYNDWKFYTKTREQLHPKSVLEIHKFSQNHTPSLISFKEGEKQYEYQFYPNFTNHIEGVTINDKKEGLWIFRFPNGNKQTEAWFVNDIQNGEQIVYYENGNVYYRGNFENGKRKGEWYFYDNEGNLLETKIF